MMEKTLAAGPSTASLFTGILANPKRFFSEDAATIPASRAVFFLSVCSGMSAAAGLASVSFTDPVRYGLIPFVNALLMTLLAAILGFVVMELLFGKKSTFSVIFKIYCVSSAITLLFSWVPGSGWFTEPWKWWLVYTGLKLTCGLTGLKACLILATSLAVQVAFFCSLYLAL